MTPEDEARVRELITEALEAQARTFRASVVEALRVETKRFTISDRVQL